jgi:hypothetical protein
LGFLSRHFDFCLTGGFFLCSLRIGSFFLPIKSSLDLKKMRVSPETDFDIVAGPFALVPIVNNFCKSLVSGNACLYDFL